MTPAAQFTAVMRAPLVRTIDDQSVTFPLLTSAELAEMGEIIRDEWWTFAQKNPKGSKFTEIQWFRVRQEIDEAVLPIIEILKRVRTMPGATWCIERSLKKGGYTDEQRAAIHESIPPTELDDIAMLVSRLKFIPKQPAKPDAADPVNRPLPGAGELQSPESTGVRSPSNSSSSESKPAA